MWSGVRVLLEATHPGEAPLSNDLFEDRIVVIEAEDESSAREKAERNAGEEAPSYLNQFGDEVSWTVVDVLGAQPLIDE